MSRETSPDLSQVLLGHVNHLKTPQRGAERQRLDVVGEDALEVGRLGRNAHEMKHGSGGSRAESSTESLRAALESMESLRKT